MCGIAGILDFDASYDADRLERDVVRMADALRHRGPDDAGAWVDQSAGIALGHRRLSVVDLSPMGHQPMVSRCERYVVVFNGEIYNFRALRKELEALGYRFRGRSDTEVMLTAFTEWGIEGALPRLNGMFAFAVWDRKERSLCLARDRMGEKPLYYGWMGSTFMFASELKGLRTHPSFQGDVDREALALYLRHNCVPAPWSIYRDIRKLLPGSLVRIGPGRQGEMPSPTPYWSFEEAAIRALREPFQGSDDAAVDALDALLRDAVAMRMEADVPLGAFLSGGVDSSTIVALMAAQSTRPVRTFAIGNHDPAFDEAPDARRVASHLGTDHTELYVDPADALDVIPRLPTLYDEPFADSSQIPTFLVSELARRHVTVSLSGDGGDELFAGYNRHVLGESVLRRTRSIPVPVRRLAAGALTAVRPASWEALGRAAGPLLPHNAKPRLLSDKIQKLAAILRLHDSEAMYVSLTSHWQDPASVLLDAVEPETAASNGAWGRIGDPVRRMMYLDAVTYLPDDVLTKVDRATMAVSLEGRMPMLDHRVVEFAWQIPLEMKIRGGRGKWLLRRVLSRYVPDALIERPKMGFGVPIGAWLRGPLRDWTEELLAPARLQREGFFDPTPIRRCWTEHLSGRRDRGYLLWDVLMFQCWLEEQRSAKPVSGPDRLRVERTVG